MFSLFRIEDKLFFFLGWLCLTTGADDDFRGSSSITVVVGEAQADFTGCLEWSIG